MAHAQQIRPASVLASPAFMSHREHALMRQPEEQPRTMNSHARCQPPSSQNRSSPMRTTRVEYNTTFVPNKSTPLHLQITSDHEGFESMIVERRQDDDGKSQVSELDMGSLKANPHWHPSRDPTFIPFVPPVEIVIRLREPIREESANVERKSSPGVVGGMNPVTGAEFVLRQSSCNHYGRVEKQSAAEEDQLSLSTGETEDVLSDGYGSTETMLQGKSRKGLLRREISHILKNKVNIFKRKSTPSRGVFRIQSRSSCMV